MTTLAVSKAATDRTITTVAALGIESNYPIPITLDVEQLLVTRQVAKPGNVYRVEGGQNGTRPVGHAAGATITTGWGGGLGGVTVDNGSDPPASVTTLVAPGADVSTPGSATLLYLGIQTADFSVATPDIIDPVHNGPELITIPAGAYFQAWITATESFDIAAEVIVAAGLSTLNAWPISDYGHLSTSGVDPTAFLREEPILYNDGPRRRPLWCKAIQQIVVCVAIYSAETPPTIGAGVLAVLSLTPAS